MAVLMMKRIVFVVLTSAVMNGCAVAGEQYAWSHSSSGDYLFAYDQDQCAVLTAGDTSGPEFFGCMRKLGYFLVDGAAL